MNWRRFFTRTPDGGEPRREAPDGSVPDAPGPGADVDAALELVRAYHRATKHAPARYARGPGWMDWDTQPDPFRRWQGAELVLLERDEPGDALAPDEPRYDEVFALGRVAPRPLDRASLSRLLFDSLALSAWKRAGQAHWSLRVNPSSGNLHPTEAHLLLPAVPGVCATPVLAHYAPKEHGLEVRAAIEPELWERLSAGFPPGTALVGLSSIGWRESWKYGERAYRYCQHDSGHALACLALAGAALGWRATLLDDLGSDEVEALLGLADTQPPEAEEPDLVVALHPVGTRVPSRLDRGAIAEVARLARSGAPSRLSPDHEDWAAVDLVAAACRTEPDAAPRDSFEPPWPPLVVEAEPISFRRVARGRRSAVAMDGRTGLAADGLFQALRRTLPGRDEAPWTALPWRPRVHLVLFVHRVAGLDPGLYALVRDPDDGPALRAALDGSFDWSRPAGCPEWLPLVHMRTGDARGLAGHLACDQAIAADGCFAVAMLARFEASLAADGPRAYPRLFRECGAIGQCLYLEAEALGLSATGIGCYFDDSVHRALGLRDGTYQSLYHFTVGGRVDDPRITSEPAYG